MSADATGGGAMIDGMTEIATGMIDRLELDLMAAKRQGECVAYFLAFGPDYTEALAAGQALIDRLRARGLTIKVETARAPNGMALLLEDTTPIVA